MYNDTILNITDVQQVMARVCSGVELVLVGGSDYSATAAHGKNLTSAHWTLYSIFISD